MEKLKNARELLKTVNIFGDMTNINPVIISNFNNYTVMISESTLGDNEPPVIEIIRNKDLLRLYGYACKCFNGDEAFDEFEGQLAGIDGMDEIEIAFTDLFFALSTIDTGNICHILDFDKYMAENLKQIENNPTE